MKSKFIIGTALLSFILVHCSRSNENDETENINRSLTPQKTLVDGESKEVILDPNDLRDDLPETLALTRGAIFTKLNKMISASPTDLNFFESKSYISWLHPSFNTQAMKLNIGKYSFYEIPTLSPEVLASLKIKLFDHDYQSSLGLMQYETWKIMSTAQLSGMRFGIMPFQASFIHKVNGLYFSQLKFIGMNLISNSGTIVHELRHHLQHLEIKPFEGYQLKNLSQECATAAVTYFGEIDATNVQLPYWDRMFDSFEFIREGLTVANSNAWRESPQDWHINRSLLDNLSYPRAAFETFLKTACPNELTQATTIAQAKIDEQVKTINALTYSTFRLKSEFLNAVFDVQKKCQNPSFDDLQNEVNLNCVNAKKFLQNAPSKIAEVKKTWSKAVHDAATERSEALRQIFGAIPNPLKIDLCRTANGFSFLTSCEGI